MKLHQQNAKPFSWRGETFPSLASFCLRYAVHESTVRTRLRRGITDHRLIQRGRLDRCASN